MRKGSSLGIAVSLVALSNAERAQRVFIDTAASAAAGELSVHDDRREALDSVLLHLVAQRLRLLRDVVNGHFAIRAGETLNELHRLFANAAARREYLDL